MKCRVKREMKDTKTITMKDGKPATWGACPVCGTRIVQDRKELRLVLPVFRVPRVSKRLKVDNVSQTDLFAGLSPLKTQVITRRKDFEELYFSWEFIDGGGI